MGCHCTSAVSEIGARLSWTGPYLEAANIVMQRETESLEVQRVQILLDLPATIAAMEPVIGEFVLDEGEIVQGLSDGSEIPDPFIWAQLLTKLHESIKTVGAFKLQNFDMLLGDVSLKRLSLEIIPDLGVIANRLHVRANIRYTWHIHVRYILTLVCDTCLTRVTYFP